MSPTSINDSDFMMNAMVPSFVAIVIACGYLLGQLGTPFLDFEPVVRTLGMTLFVLHFPALVRLLAGVLPKKNRAFVSDAFLILIEMGMLACAGWLMPGNRSLVLLYFLGSVGACVFVIRWAIWMASGRMIGKCGIMLASLFLGLFLTGSVYSRGLQNPLALPLLQYGKVDNDTIFHAAIANIQRTYEVRSTGLDGLPPLKYHTGSHWFFAHLCNVLQISVLDFYMIGFAVFVLPLWIYSQLALASACSRILWPSANRRLTEGFAFWFVFLLANINVLPMDFAEKVLAGSQFPIISESYCLSLVLAFLGMAVALEVWQQPRTVVQVLLICFGMPVILCVISLCKISTGLVFGAMAGFAFIRLGLWKKWYYVISLILAGITVYVICFHFSFNPNYGSSEKGIPCCFYLHWTPREWIAYVPLFYAFWTIVLSCFLVRSVHVSNLEDFLAALRQGRLLSLEIAIVMILVSHGPVILGYAHISVVYFIDIPRWFCVVLLMAYLSRNKVLSSIDGLKTNLAKLPFAQLALVLISTFAGINLFVNVHTVATRFLVANLQERNLLVHGTDFEVIETRLKKFLRQFNYPKAWSITHDWLQTHRWGQPGLCKTVQFLQHLGQLSLEEKRGSLVYIPKSNREFWDIYEHPLLRRGTAFLAPALSGIAMIDGIPEFDLEVPWNDLGLAIYDLQSSKTPQAPWRERRADLCRRAAQLGCHRIYAIDGNANGEIEMSVISCPPNSSSAQE